MVLKNTRRSTPVEGPIRRWWLAADIDPFVRLAHFRRWVHNMKQRRHVNDGCHASHRRVHVRSVRDIADDDLDVWRKQACGRSVSRKSTNPASGTMQRVDHMGPDRLAR